LLAAVRFKRLSPADSRITRAAVASHGPPHGEAGGIGQSRSLGVSILVYSRACVRLREGTRTHFLGTRWSSPRVHDHYYTFVHSNVFHVHVYTRVCAHTRVQVCVCTQARINYAHTHEHRRARTRSKRGGNAQWHAAVRFKRLSPADSRITRAAVASHGPPHGEAGGIGQSRSLGVSILVYSRACVRLREGTRTHFLGTRSKSAGANSTARAGDERERIACMRWLQGADREMYLHRRSPLKDETQRPSPAGPAAAFRICTHNSFRPSAPLSADGVLQASALQRRFLRR
jgi:hypothetical protein